MRWLLPAFAALLTVSSALAADMSVLPHRRPAVVVAPAPRQEIVTEVEADSLISPAIRRWPP
jgi:hypothetical protein